MKLTYKTQLLRWFIIIGIMAACGCGQQSMRWPQNNTTIHSVTWHLPVADSASILTQEGDYFTLHQFANSLLQERDEIVYAPPAANAMTHQPGRIDQQVTRSSDTSIVEYYQFRDNNVYFTGVATGDTARPMLYFDPPLLLMPANLTAGCTSKSRMKTYGADDNGLNFSVTIVPKQEILLRIPDGSLRPCVLMEMTYKQDATVACGEHNLIVPEAVFLKQNMLIDKETGILAE